MEITQELLLRAPAKINVFLHVTGQRMDGYHDLQSVFRAINLFDEIQMRTRVKDHDIKLECNEDLGPIDQNLVYRAARAMQARANRPVGVDIDLLKSIPVGAGLGGGSSDAAATLVGLNHVWQLGMSSNELREVGSGLGADVPFFVEGGDAWVTGVGDELTPCGLEEHWYLLVYPCISIPTQRIFSDPDLTRDSQPSTIARFLAEPSSDFWHNDLEPVARRLYPEVNAVKKWLSREGAAKMSGSGSTVFLQLANEAKGRELLEELPRQWKGFVVQAGRVPSLQDQLREALSSTQIV